MKRRSDQDKTLPRFAPPPALCAVPAGVGSSAPGIPDETLLMAVAVASFIGAGMWMFRRYGRPQADTPRAEPPGLRPEALPSPA